MSDFPLKKKQQERGNNASLSETSATQNCTGKKTLRVTSRQHWRRPAAQHWRSPAIDTETTLETPWFCRKRQSITERQLKFQDKIVEERSSGRQRQQQDNNCGSYNKEASAARQQRQCNNIDQLKLDQLCKADGLDQCEAHGMAC